MLVAALALALFGATVCFAQIPADKPRVPPGVDPGGVAIAVIGAGVNYSRPEIARLLARDGEGEIIGWDFVDNDRRPYAACARAGADTARCEDYTLLAVREYAPRSRFIVVRVQPSEPQTLVDAIKLVAGTGARLVLLTDHVPEELAQRFATEAARRFPDHLIVAAIPAPAGDVVPVNLVISSRGAEIIGLAARELARTPDMTPAALRRALARSPQ